MERHHFTLILVFVGLLAACRGQRAAEYVTETLDVDGVSRTYHIHFPPDFNKPDGAPLVLALHGGGGQALKFKARISARRNRPWNHY